MTEVLIIGSGKIAENMIAQFSGLGNIKAFITGRNVGRVNYLKKKFALPNNVSKQIELVIICVSDHAILEVAKDLADHFPNALFLHTSGATSSSILSGKVDRYGLFYPLQTFSVGRSVDFREIPLLINSNSEKDLVLIKLLASKISSKVLQISEQDRMILHVAAVLVNNFANKLYDEAFQLLDSNNLDFQLLKPLMKETINKLDVLSPRDAQTGPAIRGDISTINHHIELLGSNTPLAELYKSLTKIINPKLEL